MSLLLVLGLVCIFIVERRHMGSTHETRDILVYSSLQGQLQDILKKLILDNDGGIKNFSTNQGFGYGTLAHNWSPAMVLSVSNLRDQNGVVVTLQV